MKNLVKTAVLAAWPVCAGTVGLAVALAPQAVQAQGVPTIDTRSIAQQITQYQQLLEDFGIQTDIFDNLLEQLDVLNEQFAQLTEIVRVLQEARDQVGLIMGGDLDALLEADFGDILSLAQSIQNGDWSELIGPNGPAMRTQMERVLTRAGFDEDTIRSMATSGNEGAERTAVAATTGAIVAAAGQASHENAGRSYQRIEALVGAISDQETFRESLDLNTRVTAELGVILLQMLELQSVATLAAGQGGVLDAATIAEERRYMDFTIPDLQ